MGCGQSSLKGEKPEDIQESAPKPMKKVATNFSTPDYEATAGSARRNTEYAPHDDVTKRPSEALSPLTEKPSNPIDKDAITQPGASTQPQTANVAATNFEDRLSGGQSTQDPLGVDTIAPKQPYHDVTVDSPSSPTAPQQQFKDAAVDSTPNSTAHNVAAAFPESHDNKHAQ